MDKHLEALKLFRTKHIFDRSIEAALDAAISALSHAAGQEAVAYIVPVARVTQDGSYEDGPSELCFADEADDYVRRVGAPLVHAPAQPPASAEVGRDAERYRWLRDPPFVHPLPAWIAGQGNAHIDSDWLTGEHADAAIDAAMAASSGRKGGGI